MKIKPIFDTGATLAEFAKAGMAPGVTSLAVGQVERQIPKALWSGKTAANRGWRSRYTPATGLPELRHYFAKQFANRGLLGATFETTICGAGATPLLAVAFQALVHVGDQVLVIAPYYPKFVDAIRQFGGEAVIISAEEWRARLTTQDFPEDQFKKIIGVVFNSPVNPTGYVYASEEVLALVKIASDRGWWIISDETYQALVYDEAANFCLSPGALAPERTVVIGSCSKELCLPGERLGYATGPEKLIKAMSGLLTGQMGCPNESIQRALIYAIDKHGEQLAKFPAELCLELGKNRQLVGQLCTEIGVRAAPMMGAFYAWIDVMPDRLPAVWPGSEAFARLLLKKHQVAVIPGVAFGLSPKDTYIRVSYGGDQQTITAGLRAVGEAIRSL